METVVLRCGDLEATLLPGMGMNMASYRRGDIEVIDQSTRGLFEERYAGLGALIGPHFHRRPEAIIPPIKDDSLFPHVQRVKANGVKEPFSHGIARYAPWATVESNETSVKAQLKGSDEWNGVALRDLEGQDFTIDFQATLSPKGLNLRLNVRSDTDSLMGIHYYYRLPKGDARVESEVLPTYCDQGQFKEIPADWSYQSQKLTFPLNEAADYGFRPARNPLAGAIQLHTSEYTLSTHYQCTNAENSWQLYHPEGASFVCIEPMSALNPRKPRLSVSGLEIDLAIVDKEESVR